MLGFYAEAASTAITVDYGELEDARWFERDWLLSHADDDNFRLPRRNSIARRLIEDWLAGAAGLTRREARRILSRDTGSAVPAFATIILP